MADPETYAVSFSFSDFQANSPSTPLPGPKVDAELANAASAIAAVIQALRDVRRSDGKLQNGSVTFDSLALGLRLTFDPTNGDLVAAAVAGAQADAAAALAYRDAAAGSAADALAQAVAAAASAADVNFALYLPKAGNLEGLGNIATARDNIGLGSSAVRNVGTTAGDIVQIDGSGRLPALDASQLTNIDAVPVGTTIWIGSSVAPPGFLKENGALLSRASFPRLWAFASSSGNLATEASWFGGATSAFSNGDLVSTFRLPETRGEFLRSLDDGRGVDPSRGIGFPQGDEIRSHVHPGEGASSSTTNALVTTGNSSFFRTGSQSVNTGATGGAETRPRNVAKLACIKY